MEENDSVVDFDSASKASSVASFRSMSKSTSSRSSRSDSTVRARARLEAARIKFDYAQKEAEVKQRQAVLQSELELITTKRDLDMAEAEYQTLAEAESTVSFCKINQDDSAEVKLSRTETFVADQTQHLQQVPAVKMEVESQMVDQVAVKRQPPCFSEPTTSTALNVHRQTIDNRDLGLLEKFTHLSVKKDILVSRLTRFSDEPEHFVSWKNSFKEVVSSVNVCPSEELDLLVQWLGPQSSRYAVSIRTANSADPARGLRRLWERLSDIYARPEMIESALRKKLDNFPKINSNDLGRLFDLVDIVEEISSLKDSPVYRAQLGTFDSSSGVNIIVNKLPSYLQEKWTSEALNYKKRYSVAYPPFTFFCKFLGELARDKNDPSFWYNSHTDNSKFPTSRPICKPSVNTRKTEVSGELQNPGAPACLLHDSAHPLDDCRAFKRKPLGQRREILRTQGLCYRCCLCKHLAKDCMTTVKCSICESDNHRTAMHGYLNSPPQHGGESSQHEPQTHTAVSCTQVCDDISSVSKSCSKTLLVRVRSRANPNKELLTYAMIDDQSNQSLARSEFFDYFQESGPHVQYTLSSCSGSTAVSGRRATGYIIESFDRTTCLSLPTIIECDGIPGQLNEVATPNVVNSYTHLRDLVSEIPPLVPEASVMLLVGRDSPEVHHVTEQRIGRTGTPFAQKLPLGWVVIGETCMNGVHTPKTVNVNKIHFTRKGRPTCMTPCPNDIEVRIKKADTLGDDVFQRTQADDKPAFSVEDREFLALLDSTIQRNEEGNWVAPLPFRTDRPRLPNNYEQALRRAKSLDAGLRRDPVKRQHMMDFMTGIINNGHAEIAPTISPHSERWYLPLFGVYNEKKPGQIRGVFDSSAKHDGVSLNQVLLSGPDLTNSLLGVLLRFRRESIAITGDIQQMFYGFKVRPDHRDYLRFLWYKDNVFGNELVEYRMTAHVFGNSPSPAIATYALRRTVQDADPDVAAFVHRNFYVDDGLASTPDAESAVSLMKRTQQCLAENGNLRLHKIVSNDRAVLSAFETDDLAKDLKDLDLHVDTPPIQRTLGLYWDTELDAFRFQITEDKKPFTKRGILSTVNGLYDPIGFAAPVVLEGRLLLRDLMSSDIEWDEALPMKREKDWESWRTSLHELSSISIPRKFVHMPTSEVQEKEVHIFTDASQEAIAAVAFLRVCDIQGHVQQGFILGKSKVAPKHGHTIPRLELCAAVLGTELGQCVSEHLDIPISDMKFYTDSKVVLGYINNRSRRFYVYVANRVDRINYATSPLQWKYVPTECNPADCGTRATTARDLPESMWLQGTHFLDDQERHKEPAFSLVQPDLDKEVRPDVTVLKVKASELMDTSRIKCFSSWNNLILAVTLLKHLADSFRSSRKDESCKGWHMCSKHRTVELKQRAERFLIRQVQQTSYNREIERLAENRPIPRDSPVMKLSPFLDDHGILRVGGRLQNSPLPSDERQPILIPGTHHLATLLIRHFHESVHHQGRLITEGAVRAGGFWITGGKRLISFLLHRCATCRRLRAPTSVQKMADIPEECLAPCPPFTYIGVDIFGPWNVSARRTRGGQANSKRWAVLFTCLVIRAVHIELVEELSTSSFINALRRFFAIRGKPKEIRSDRGTNFIGATDPLHIDAINVEDEHTRILLYNSGTVWKFNPPYASHTGGAWERMIGIARRILDSMLLGKNKLSHEVLATFMAEVCAIINSRPIAPVSTDPEDPEILSPSTLLTQKTEIKPESLPDLGIKDTYQVQWRHVQALADQFWDKWRRDYLPTLQSRRKWHNTKRNLKPGDIVLVRDKESKRSSWPVGMVTKTFPSHDKLIRKVEVKLTREGRARQYIRPVTDVVPLLID